MSLHRGSDQQRAVTLVEVVAAAVIFSIAAVSFLTAQSAGLKQLETAKLELVSQAIARNLIVQWKLTKEDISLAAEDRVDGYTDWRWRRENELVTLSDDIRATEVVLTVEHKGFRIWTRQYRWWIKNDSNDRS